MPAFIAFLFLLFSTQASHAEESLKDYAEFQAFHVEKTIESIELALLNSIDYIERNPNEEVLIQHKMLAKYAEHTPALRAIITTDATGKLKVDSVTYPTKNVNLQDREYVKNALSLKNKSLYIGTPLVGRTSGLSFIPFSKILIDHNKKANGVIAAIMHPGFLIDQDKLCSQCFMGVFNKDNKTLVTYPSNSKYPEDFLQKIHMQSKGEKFEYNFNGETLNSWITHSKRYDLKIIVSSFTHKK